MKAVLGHPSEFGRWGVLPGDWESHVLGCTAARLPRGQHIIGVRVPRWLIVERPRYSHCDLHRPAPTWADPRQVGKVAGGSRVVWASKVASEVARD